MLGFEPTHLMARRRAQEPWVRLSHQTSGFQEIGGEGGIRTHDTLASMPHFECGDFNHSTTSPAD
jgi:hypothetical protein